MPSPVALRRKIKSVKSTKQITRAMQLVAASKMRRAQTSALGSRAYFENAWDILKSLRMDPALLSHPLLKYREGERITFVLFTSDRGLCGGLNSRIIKEAIGYVRANRKKQIDIITVGKKGEQALKRYHVNLYASFIEMPEKPTYADLRPLINMAVGRYISNETDRVIILYTKFHSVVRQEAMFKTLLPIPVNSDDAVTQMHDYLFEPSKEAVIDEIVPYLIGNQIFEAMLESIASEHSARMVSMKSATENADEMIYGLNLVYNKMRQASITRELSEIIAGVEAL